MQPPAEIQVWHANLDGPEVPDDLWLSAEERARATRMRFDRDRRRFVAAHGFLRALLARQLGCETAAIVFGELENGKPLIAAPATALRFNLSHSDANALAAVAIDREVGVDVELLRPLRGGDGLARRVLSNGELAERERAPAAREAALLVAWTRKEAVMKACGVGLRLDPASVETGVSPSDTPRIVDLGPLGAAWSVASLAVGPDYAAAVAAEGARMRVIARAWRWCESAAPVS